MVDSEICLWCPKRDSRVKPGEKVDSAKECWAGVFCGAAMNKLEEPPSWCPFILEQLMSFDKKQSGESDGKEGDKVERM